MEGRKKGKLTGANNIQGRGKEELGKCLTLKENFLKSSLTLIICIQVNNMQVINNIILINVKPLRNISI